MTQDQCCFGFILFIGGIIAFCKFISHRRKLREENEYQESRRRSALIEAKFQQNQRVMRAEREEYEKRHKRQPIETAIESDDDYYPDYWGEDEDDD